ncbi:hypothetical protein D3C84_937520 [compost metagenome]
MHNRDEENHRITANDFFTYNLIKKSRLYELVENEYLTLWEEADSVLEWDRYYQAAEHIRMNDLREREKVELLRDACRPLAEPAAPLVAAGSAG